MSIRTDIALILLALSGHSIAQNISGSITGMVKDPAGSVVPTATVTLTNQETRGVNDPDGIRPASAFVNRIWPTLIL